MVKKQIIFVFALMFYGLTISPIAKAQTDGPEIPRWAAIVHQLALQAPVPANRSTSTGVFPSVIPEYLRAFDHSGVVETYNAAAPIDTSDNAFFQSIGANGRACVTCHEPRSGWSVSAHSIRRRFYASHGTDPIFRVVDGATCDTDDVSSFHAARKAYRLLLSKGLIRVFLPLPETQLGSDPAAPRDFEIIAVDDPYGCTDLFANKPTVSFYRRPLPAANLRFLGCPTDDPSCAPSPLPIMWDGREKSLDSQARDATLGHAQAKEKPTPAQLAEIVNFESNIYDAQIFSFAAGRLDRDGATGGPFLLSQQDFQVGINDPFSPDFNDMVFTLFDAWENLTIDSEEASNRNEARASINRGERIFNTKTFTITDVNGLNLQPTDPLGHNAVENGTCTICHDSPNVGNHSKKLPLDIGIAGASPPALDIRGLPIFTVRCTSGPLQGKVFKVTDLGRAMLTGKCADIGKMKGPILHALASRAPYFHNGSAATLMDVVDFYDKRFKIGFTDQEKADLVAFLKAL
jgi:cytochrome c peroxidase